MRALWINLFLAYRMAQARDYWLRLTYEARDRLSSSGQRHR
jgi:hypothetical protein